MADNRPLSNAQIHPTAIVSDSAILARNVSVGPYCIIADGVELGEGVVLGSHTHLGARDPLTETRASEISIGSNAVIGAHTILTGKVSIGTDVRIDHFVTVSGEAHIGHRTAIHAGAVIGGPGQFPGRHRHHGIVLIGDDVVIREQCCITKPVLTESTRIGDSAYLMARTQVDHDCQIDHHAKTAAGVTLGGSVHIGHHSYVGMNAVIHQGIRIGPGCMIGMNGVILKHVPPFATIISRKFAKLNERGLKLRGASDDELLAIAARYTKADSGRGAAERNEWIRSIDAFYSEIGDEAAILPEFT